MFYDDHPIPHFHVMYNEDNAVVSTENLIIWRGHLSPRNWKLVRDWALARQSELREAWERAERNEPPVKLLRWTEPSSIIRKVCSV